MFSVLYMMGIVENEETLVMLNFWNNFDFMVDVLLYTSNIYILFSVSKKKKKVFLVELTMDSDGFPVL